MPKRARKGVCHKTSPKRLDRCAGGFGGRHDVREPDAADKTGLVRRMTDKLPRRVDLMADGGCPARRSRPMGPILAVILCLAGGAAAADEFRDEMMGFVIRPCFLAWIDHYAGPDHPAHLKDEEIDRAIAEHAGMVEAWIENAREFTRGMTEGQRFRYYGESILQCVNRPPIPAP